LKKNKIAIFGSIAKFLKLIVFWQIFTKFANFGQIQLLWQGLTACLHVKGKKKKNMSSHLEEDLPCDGLLESPLNFPSTQKVLENPITNWNQSCALEIHKFHIWNSRSFKGDTTHITC
jgi:hypothetical protein